MPTDVNVPKWRCDLCTTVYEGTDALAAATHCEHAPTPEPLPDGTFLLSGFADLLDKSRWRRTEGHVIEPWWSYDSDRATTPEFDLDNVAVRSHRSHRKSTRGVDGHTVMYNERLVTPRKQEYGREPLEVRRFATDSAHLWPHRPGVLNWGYDINKVTAASGTEGWQSARAIGRTEDAQYNRSVVHATRVIDDQDAQSLQALIAQIAPDMDPLVRDRYVLGPERFTWDEYKFDKRQQWLPNAKFLRPGLNPETRAALLALCTDTTGHAHDPLATVGSILVRGPEHDRDGGRYVNRRDWQPSIDEPHYGVAHAAWSSRQAFRPWLETLALLDAKGDPVAALRWLTKATREEQYERVEREAQAFLDGDPDALIHVGILSPSEGMTRGPRQGCLRPEHKAAAAVLGLDWTTSKAKTVISDYTASATEALNHLGVTMPDELNTPLFGGAPIIAIASGKGGVGKSTTAAALAHAAADQGLRTLLIDADVTGPSLGALYGLGDGIPVTADGDLDPTEVVPNLLVVSASQAVAPQEIAQWGEDTTRMWLRFIGLTPLLNRENAPDLVIIDMPPGYTAQHTAVDHEMKPTGWLMCTTGSPLAHADLRRALRAAGRAEILGIVESLSVTPSGERLYPTEATPEFAAGHEVPFLGSLPWTADPQALRTSMPIGAALAAVVGSPAAAPETVRTSS